MAGLPDSCLESNLASEDFVVDRLPITDDAVEEAAEQKPPLAVDTELPADTRESMGSSRC